MEHPVSDQLDRALVGENITRAMQTHQVSMRELAKRSGIDRRDLRRYTQGRSMPTVHNLARIASGFGLPVTWFLADHNGPQEAEA